ncbi:AGC/YANK protein kinase Ppk33 [Schizosaccharomyces octosporus yFS286]|uniref:AGC/YANK protein kinase Ppk33 n=1 Tax=Schizosaccharomyces octosporus (strain yFS286) TaxID=483514 RepID=S9Q0G6_SCHOY|nr:AGC/YANK protein kinase Ppk33 [Schizosaccharomyces octosporus yFS286]EPX73687.1 AGC/YANK protein kinase Ppk33 [Schizosaccharomyces octosporus yFS286]
MGNQTSKLRNAEQPWIEQGQKEKFFSISQFKLCNVVGKGSWSTVFVVKDRSSKQKFALKCINKKKHNPGKIKQLLTEVSLLRSLDHPLLCRFYSEFQDDNKIYLVSDLMLGGDLRYHIAQNRFQESVVCVWIAELASALIYIHSKGILHRDIKPDNILLDEYGHCRLVDFNVASRLSQQTPDGKGFVKGRVGTPAYMSPETLVHAISYRESDWWSLGITMYECLLQTRPFSSTMVVNWIRSSEKEKNSLLETMCSSLELRNNKQLDVLSKEARVAIQGFLEPSIKNRFGHNENKIPNISFFSSVCFDTISQGKWAPKFRPKSGKLYADPILELEATF